MDRKLKRWELALMLGLLITMVSGAWLSGEQKELSDKVIRLHIIANSDDVEDQKLMLVVRDQILHCAEQLYPEHADLEQAGQTLKDSLELFEAAGKEVVTEWGKDYPVTAQLEQCWFPTKEYEDFTLPAGTYRALRVVIGEGKGQNWWCVAFPPLCLGAASETLDDAVQAGHFTSSQVSMITEENEGYVFKLKGMELLGEFQGFLSGLRGK